MRRDVDTKRETRKVWRQMEAEWEEGREVRLRAPRGGSRAGGASPARTCLDVQPLNRQSVQALLLPKPVWGAVCWPPGADPPIKVPEKFVLFLLSWPCWGWGPRVGV